MLHRSTARTAFRRFGAARPGLARSSAHSTINRQEMMHPPHGLHRPPRRA